MTTWTPHCSSSSPPCSRSPSSSPSKTATAERVGPGLRPGRALFKNCHPERSEGPAVPRTTSEARARALAANTNPNRNSRSALGFARHSHAAARRCSHRPNKVGRAYPPPPLRSGAGRSVLCPAHSLHGSLRSPRRRGGCSCAHPAPSPCAWCPVVAPLPKVR